MTHAEPRGACPAVAREAAPPSWRWPVLALLLAAVGGCVAAPGEATGTFASSTPAASTADRDQLKQVANAATAASTPGSAAYKVGPQDVLDITVFKVPDLSRSVQVADNGSINFPLIGEVKAGGHTPQEVERIITAQLGARYLQSPQVSVFVKEYNSQRVTIEGSVKKPGLYPLRGSQSLVQLLAQAGGLENDTASGIAVLFRGSGAGRLAARYDLDAIRSGKAEDPQIVEGDTVVVETSQGKVAFGYIVRALPAATLLRPF